jgi:large subunit ribosomal protein L6
LTNPLTVSHAWAGRINHSLRHPLLRSFSSSPQAHSKVGMRKIRLPPSVTLSYTKYDPISNPPPPTHPNAYQSVCVKGPLGELKMPLEPFVKIASTSPSFSSISAYSESGEMNSSQTTANNGPKAQVADHGSIKDVDKEGSDVILSVSVENPKDKHQKSMWGTRRSLLNNLIEGVSEGFTIPLRLVG